MTWEIIHDDCLNAMKNMADNLIDFVVTDPPYSLGFMGKHWDASLPSIDIWKEMLRICKPGSHLLAFGGTRTFHRLTCAIEDAGWEIRDCLMWLFGQGFPKSHNFGKQLGGKWEGYGTALKPSFEPVIIAQKPFSLKKDGQNAQILGLHPNWEPIILAMKSCEGTFAQNAEKWGLAGINIDKCRIESNGEHKVKFVKGRGNSFLNESKGMFTPGRSFMPTNSDKGRWPANLILDEAAAELIDQQSGINASRFFYCTKASSPERQGSRHPTIKPKKLMSYLITLLAPPGNPICLDPFMGSGTTGICCKELGISFIGIEKEKEYFEDAKRKIENAKESQQYELFK